MAPLPSVPQFCHLNANASALNVTIETAEESDFTCDEVISL